MYRSRRNSARVVAREGGARADGREDGAPSSDSPTAEEAHAAGSVAASNDPSDAASARQRASRGSRDREAPGP